MNTDPEISLITSLLYCPDEFAETALRVQPDDLNHSDARQVFRAMIDLNAVGAPIEHCAIADQLIANGCSRDSIGPMLDRVTDGEPNENRIPHFVDLIHKDKRRRKVEALAETISGRVTANESPDDILEYVQQTVWELESARVASEGKPIRQLMPSLLSHLADLRLMGDRFPGISTGFHPLDAITRGLKPSELWVIGALPGRGKTAFGLQMAVSAAKSGLPVLFFSMEMSAEQLQTRMLGAELGVSIVGNPAVMNDQKWNATLECGAELSKLPIIVDDSSELSPAELTLRARAKIRQYGVKLIVVDYLQLLRGPEKDIRERVGNAANVLRQLAKDTRLPVVALSQLRRPSNENDRPSSIELKESGDIECHASHVILLYTPFNEKNCPTGEDELIVGKNRTGPLGSMPAFFNRQTLTFAERETRLQ